VNIWREILVVDDSKVFLQMMATVMQPYAGRVHDASGPAEAIAIIDERPGLGLVLTDVVMHGGTGFDVPPCITTARASTCSST
jgi:CheY-like chemotaxis protein